jgi:RNA polymerase sigma factor (sigma-70 family)
MRWFPVMAAAKYGNRRENRLYAPRREIPGARPDSHLMMETIPASRVERFERLYRAHVDAVYRYALRRNPGAADDVVAEAFLVAWRRLEDVPAEAERPWLLGVARRTHANARRSARRQSALAERLGELARPGEGPSMAEHTGDDALHAALACLPPRDQELLMLVAWDGLDNAGVAQVMGCSRANVAVRLHRAQRRLARELERLGGDPGGVAQVAEEGGRA